MCHKVLQDCIKKVEVVDITSPDAFGTTAFSCQNLDNESSEKEDQTKPLWVNSVPLFNKRKVSSEHKIKQLISSSVNFTILLVSVRMSCLVWQKTSLILTSSSFGVKWSYVFFSLHHIHFRWRNTCRTCPTRSLVRVSSTMSSESPGSWSPHHWRQSEQTVTRNYMKT